MLSIFVSFCLILQLTGVLGLQEAQNVYSDILDKYSDILDKYSELTDQYNDLEKRFYKLEASYQADNQALQKKTEQLEKQIQNNTQEACTRNYITREETETDKVLEYRIREGKQIQDEAILSGLYNITDLHMLEKLIVQPSCFDWKQLGFAESGYYLIDPDGQAIGEAPFTVYCDMITGFSFVSHDMEQEGVSTRCSNPGCYQRHLTYAATQTQVRSLIEISESCQQYIKVTCKSTPLHRDGRLLSWWEDNFGNKHSYWAGDSSNGNETCSCGVTNACIDPRHTCNCNADVGDIWVSDEGYLSNDKALPIMKVFFGTHDSLSQLQIKYTIGPLRCFGKKTRQYPESCLDLMKTGRVTSGYYFLGKPSDIRLVYCDVQQPLLEDNSIDLTHVPLIKSIFEQLENLNNTPRQTFGNIVAFNVNSYLDFGEAQNYLKFDAVIFDTNNGYNQDTGLYTIPVSGYYMFFSNLYKSDSDDTVIYMNKNNEMTVVARSHSEVSRSSFNAAFMDTFNIGDTVGVFLFEGKIYGEIDARLSNFFGFLVS